MADPTLRYEKDGDVAVLHLDDGKANALSHDVVESITKALDRAESEAHSLLLVGRPGRLSAGFDLKAMSGGADSARGLVTAGAEMLLRLYMSPLPTVTACSGHALAAGAILLLASDVRIGARGDFKIGLNEVAIGMSLPIFGIELARDRLSKRHFQAAVNRSRIYDPEGAVNAGFLDAVAAPDALVETALREARALAELRAGAYRETKQMSRQAVYQHIRETLAEDMARITGPAS